jgi:ribonuclease J
VDGIPTDYGKLAEMGGRGVLALLADSTNAEQPGWTPSERVIDAAFDRVFQKAKGRIIIATFASLISRMQQVLDTARRYDRKVCFTGLSMIENARIAKELGYLHYEESQVVGIDVALSMPDSKVVLLVTGSQGEPTSILGRLANKPTVNFPSRKAIRWCFPPLPSREMKKVSTAPSTV